MHFGKEMNLAPFNGTYTGLLTQLNFLKIANGKYVKDINDLERDIKSAIIIEDNINNVHKSNLDNTICFKSFYGESIMKKLLFNYWGIF